MAKIESQVFDIGSGYRLKTQAIPLSGIIAVIETFRTGGRDGFRYSVDNGATFSDWRLASFNSYTDFGTFSDLYELVVDFVPNVADEYSLVGVADGRTPSQKQYGNSVYSWFFSQDDLVVMNWAFNVLEKLFDTGIIPVHISRQNSEDYSTVFFSITQFFGLIVAYGRKFRFLEENEMMMKNFIEGWNLVFTTIDTLAERQYVFRNWINEFYKRGTTAIAKKGAINGELLRLVGYDRPNEFLFGILRPQDMGWCLGHSSPTWRSTALLNQLAKDPTRESEFFENYQEYTVGSIQRVYDNDRWYLRTIGSGRSGISFEKNPIECNSGLSYAIYVKFKKLSAGDPKIDFGVRCFDKDMVERTPRQITTWDLTSSFIDGGAYSGKVPIENRSYVWKGILFDVDNGMDPNLYLNFENGIPLRFSRECRWFSPYFVQNRTSGTPQIEIEEFQIKPLELPVSQGYLGQKNFVALYAENNSLMTKKDVLAFMKQYLLNFKNVVSMNWIDPKTVFLNFTVWDSYENVPIQGAQISLGSGYSMTTDANGEALFEIPKGTMVTYVIEAFALRVVGKVDMISSRDVRVNLEIPYDLIITPDEIVMSEDGGTATAVVHASRPWAFDTPIDDKETGLTLTPMSGDAGDTLVTINIPYELLIVPNEVIIPAAGGSATVKIISTGNWTLTKTPSSMASDVTLSQESGSGDADLEIEM